MNAAFARGSASTRGSRPAGASPPLVLEQVVKRLSGSVPHGNHNSSALLQEGPAGWDCPARSSPPGLPRWLPDQVWGWRGRRRGAAQGAPCAAGRAARVPAAGARGGARGWGGPGRGRRPRHLIKRLRVSREQRAHSVVRSCPRGGSGRAEARLVRGWGRARRREETEVAAAAAALWPESGPKRGAAAQFHSPLGAPAHGGRGAAVAALPVSGAPAAARHRLQLGHPRGQCDRENRGLGSLFGFSLAMHWQLQPEDKRRRFPTLSTPPGPRPTREQVEGSPRSRQPGPARSGTQRAPGGAGPGAPRAPPPAPPGAAPSPVQPGKRTRGPTLRTAAPVPGGAVLRPGRVYFLNKVLSGDRFPPGMFAGNPAGGTLC